MRPIDSSLEKIEMHPMVRRARPKGSVYMGKVKIFTIKFEEFMSL